MAHYVVTGAAGFIGSHVSEALLARGDTVTGIDDFNAFYDPAIKDETAVELQQHAGFSLVRGSILDPAALKRCLDHGAPSAVVHLAAWAGVRPSIEKPALYQKQNVEGTVALLDALRATFPDRLPRFVFASSSSVYGENKKVPFHEDDRVDEPISPYAATKKAGELLCYTYHHLFKFDVACLRFFTVYGPRQRPDLAIHKFARLMTDGTPIPVFGDGSTSRDYTFVKDTVQGVLAAVDRPHGYRVYNLGNSRTVRLDELITTLSAALGVQPKITRLPMQPGDVPITYADVTRANTELGYQPAYPFEQGIAEFVTWFRARRASLR